MRTVLDTDSAAPVGASRQFHAASPIWIDYTAFPHIIDRIMVFSSWPVLGVFRCTSRALLARADMLQGYHVIVGSPTDLATKPCSPFGCLPALGQRDYHQWGSNRQRDQWGLARARAQLGYTRVLDIIGLGDMLLTRIAPHFRNVRVLRIRPDYDGIQQYKTPIPAHTLVVFGGRGPYPDGWRTCVGGGVERLVVTPRRSGDSGPEECLPVVVESMSRDVRDVVLHLTGYPMDGEVRDMFAEGIATMLARTRNKAFRITVVGAEDIRSEGRLNVTDREGWPHELALDSLSAALESATSADMLEPPGTSEFREAIHDALVRVLREHPEPVQSGDAAGELDGEDLRDQPPPFSRASDSLSRVAFLSLGAYAATMPRHDLILEMVEGIQGTGTEMPLQDVQVVQRGS